VEKKFEILPFGRGTVEVKLKKLTVRKGAKIIKDK
jgi:hypothetical protein